ncbi:MAG TPA: hypothetical protein VK689_22400, partial [Armatimonadota bacterium]|nr:hypothetical protein [Armatimonadota bacterium]
MTRSIFFGGVVLLAIGVGAPSQRSQAAGRFRPVERRETWQRHLTSPATRPQRLPAGWKVVPVPKDFHAKGRSTGPCGIFGPMPETVDELVRTSTTVVVGVGAGNDGSFPNDPLSSFQY